MDFEELQALRRQLIADGRSLEVGDDEAAIQPNMHFYVLAFNGGKGAPRLLRSGTFCEVITGAASLGAPRGQLGVRLAMIRWDGDIDRSRHPLDTIGLLHASDRPTLLAVQSLAGIEPAPIDERPHKQRQADPVIVNTE